jgi:hypothetical protein
MSDTIEWPAYNRTLIDRGKLTFWVPQSLAEIWYFKEESDRTYTDRAIEVLSILRFKFGLTLRETEGFAKSLFKWLGLSLGCHRAQGIRRRRMESSNSRSWEETNVEKTSPCSQ